MSNKATRAMKVIIVEPMRLLVVLEMEDTLPKMQAVVGKPIQAVYPFDETIALICYEGGKLLGLPLNRTLYDAETGTVYDIEGMFFLRGAPSKEEHFGSLAESRRSFSPPVTSPCLNHFGK